MPHWVVRIGSPSPDRVEHMPVIGDNVFLGAGGSGIVPLMAMVRQRAAEDSTIPTRLLYSSRRWDDVIYRDELARLADGDVAVGQLAPERALGKLAVGQRVQATSDAFPGERLVVTLKLQGGMQVRAAELIAAGPPFDPADLGLARIGVTVDVVLTSPLVRARQTADIVAGGKVWMLEHDGAIKWGPVAIPGDARVRHHHPAR